MKNKIRFFDKITFFIILLIVVIGMSCIYSAGHANKDKFYLKQFIWLIISIVVFFLVFSIKTEFFFRYSFFLLLAITAILFFQFLTGQIIAGTRSWFRLNSFISFQISEFVKIPMTLFLAKYFTSFDMIDRQQYFYILLIIGIPVIFIVLQPDMGVSFILCSLLLFSILLKKIRLYLILFSVLFASGIAIVGWNSYLKPYQKKRIISFLNPSKYTQTSAYQLIQSRIAIGSGGLRGKGYLKGSQTHYQFLPERHTDFIISVLGEEFGFMGVSILFFLFFIFFYRNCKFNFQTDEEFYFVFLFHGVIFFQFLINVLMAIGFFPVLGITLPFVSYGGSSLLSLFIGEAIVFRIKINFFTP